MILKSGSRNSMKKLPIYDDSVVVFEVVEGTPICDLEIFEASKVHYRIVWYFDAVFGKELADIDKLHILDILVLELFVQAHLVVAEDMLVHMKRVCSILRRQVA